jgi:hypothetical protein
MSYDIELPPPCRELAGLLCVAGATEPLTAKYEMNYSYAPAITQRSIAEQLGAHLPVELVGLLCVAGAPERVDGGAGARLREAQPCSAAAAAARTHANSERVRGLSRVLTTIVGANGKPWLGHLKDMFCACLGEAKHNLAAQRGIGVTHTSVLSARDHMIQDVDLMMNRSIYRLPFFEARVLSAGE